MTQNTFEATLDCAQQLDAGDPLASWRDKFIIDDPEEIYLDGNSLGRLPRRTPEGVAAVVREAWGRRLINSWNEDWWHAPVRVGEKIARLAGAAPGQVIVSDSTSVNLYKLVLAALEMRPGRSAIISDVLNFPSDLYILQSCRRLLGDRHNIHLLPSEDGISVNMQNALEAINEDTALVTLSQVAFKSGYLYDAEAITKRAHDAGALVLWDLSHSVGAVPVELDRWGADMAVGCTYKYLNGGPGSPAFLYVRRDLQPQIVSPIWGWWGGDSPFDFELQYNPAPDITRLLCGSPPILSLLAMEESLQPVLEAGIERIRQKSIMLTSYLIFLCDSILDPYGFRLGTPRDAERRGSHVSIRHADGFRINRAMIEAMHVIPDFRQPDNIRMGLAPLYTSFSEVWQAVDRIRQIMEEKIYLDYSEARQTVT